MFCHVNSLGLWVIVNIGNYVHLFCKRKHFPFCCHGYRTVCHKQEKRATTHEDRSRAGIRVGMGVGRGCRFDDNTFGVCNNNGGTCTQHCNKMQPSGALGYFLVKTLNALNAALQMF